MRDANRLVDLMQCLARWPDPEGAANEGAGIDMSHCHASQRMGCRSILPSNASVACASGSAVMTIMICPPPQPSPASQGREQKEVPLASGVTAAPVMTIDHNNSAFAPSLAKRGRV